MLRAHERNARPRRAGEPDGERDRRGLGSHTYNELHGATRNPYDAAKSAGGSSGGAAIALALRMLPLADGGDYGGSLRNPAGWNNVFALRPSIGRVPSSGRDLWLPSMGVLGPMARSVPDLALLLGVQAGWDARAPLGLDAGDLALYRLDLARDFRGTRIAWSGDWSGALPFEPGVLDTCRTALRVFEDLGCVVEQAVPEERAHRLVAARAHERRGRNLIASGFSAQGLPIGLQIAGPVRAERTCLELAHAYDLRTRWVERRPPPQLAS